MIDGYQRQALSTPLQIPLVYGADAVHGHSNVLDATIFPHNTGLGATRDPALVQPDRRGHGRPRPRPPASTGPSPRASASRATNAGAAATSPSARIPRSCAPSPRPTSSASRASDPSDLSGPDKVLATAKHWAGDGGTRYDAVEGRHRVSDRPGPHRRGLARGRSRHSTSTPTSRRSRPASAPSCRRTPASTSETATCACTRTPC